MPSKARTMHFFLNRLIVFGAAILFASATNGQDGPAKERLDQPWEMCLTDLRQAAKLAHAGRVADAEAKLADAAQRLPQPYASMAQVLKQSVAAQFSDVDGDATHRECEARAELMLRMGEPSLALHWAREAVRIGSEYPYGDQARLAWPLAALGQYAEAIAAYEEAIRLGQKAHAAGIERDLAPRIEALRAISADNSVATRLRFIRVQLLAWSGRIGLFRGGEKWLLALEQLGIVFNQTQEEADRRVIYDMARHCFEGIGDRASLAVWEAKMLAEPWAKSDDAAFPIAERAQQAYYAKDFPEAEKQWRLIVEKFRETKQFGIAQYNLGVALRRQQKFDAAIAEFQKLFDSPVNDRDPGASVMEIFRNYRHSGARQIALCYEAKGDAAKALEWLMEARNKHKFQSGCGTCNAMEAASIETHEFRLLQKANRIDDALKLAETAIFNEQSGGTVPYAVFVAEEYLRRGNAKQLRQRLEAQCGQQFRPWLARSKNEIDKAVKNGLPHTELMLEILDIVEVAKKGRIDELWRRIQKSKAGATLTFIPDQRQSAMEAIAATAATRLVADKQAVTFLRRKQSETFNERAWATVLLVRMGELKDADAIRTMALGVPGGFTSEEWREAAYRAQQDFCYALLLIDPNPQNEPYRGLAKTQLGHAAQRASELVRNATDSLSDEIEP